MGYLNSAVAIWGVHKDAETLVSVGYENPTKEYEQIAETAPDSTPEDPTLDALLEALPADHSAWGTWPPRAPELTTWPATWREKWTARTEALEAPGVSTTEAERVAFIEIAAERIEAGLPVKALPGEPDIEAEFKGSNTTFIPSTSDPVWGMTVQGKLY